MLISQTFYPHPPLPPPLFPLSKQVIDGVIRSTKDMAKEVDTNSTSMKVDIVQLYDIV